VSTEFGKGAGSVLTEHPTKTFRDRLSDRPELAGVRRIGITGFRKCQVYYRPIDHGIEVLSDRLQPVPKGLAGLL
jgi:hypothetical protein